MQESVKRGTDRSIPPFIAQNSKTAAQTVRSAKRRLDRRNCQANLPPIARCQRLPGVFSSICAATARAARMVIIPFGSCVDTRPLIFPLGRS